jgi:5-methylthioribose kinase
MSLGKIYYYLVDGLTEEKADIIVKGLSVIPGVGEVTVSLTRSMIEAQALRDVEAQVRLACDVAGAKFRTRVKR